jgi:hypothetical protein
MKKLYIPSPVSGGVLLSYKCSAACRHCMYACSPAWKSDWISREDLSKCLGILSGKIIPAPHGAENISLNHGLHFTGGEPFLNFDLLLYGVETAAKMQIPSTFVETNCSWCHSDAITRKKLQLLKEKGLYGILISVNPYYAEYVPFEQTERCIRISSEIFGHNLFVYQMEFYYLFKKLGITGTLSFNEAIKMQKQGYHVELFLSGRATQTLRDFYPAFPAKKYFKEPCRPAFLRSWHNHFDNYGNFMPGYCGGISLGNWHDLDKLIEKGIDLATVPVLNFIITDDFEGLFDYAQSRGFKEDKGGYISKCDLCLQLRKFLVSRQDFPELQPRQFYEQISYDS